MYWSKDVPCSRTHHESSSLSSPLSWHGFTRLGTCQIYQDFALLCVIAGMKSSNVWSLKVLSKQWRRNQVLFCSVSFVPQQRSTSRGPFVTTMLPSPIHIKHWYMSVVLLAGCRLPQAMATKPTVIRFCSDLVAAWSENCRQWDPTWIHQLKDCQDIVLFAAYSLRRLKRWRAATSDWLGLSHDGIFQCAFLISLYGWKWKSGCRACSIFVRSIASFERECNGRGWEKAGNEYGVK